MKHFCGILLGVAALALGACNQLSNAHSDKEVILQDGLCSVKNVEFSTKLQVVIDPIRIPAALTATGLPFAQGGVLVTHSNGDLIYVAPDDTITPVAKKKVTPEFIYRITPIERDNANYAREKCGSHLSDAGFKRNSNFLFE